MIKPKINYDIPIVHLKKREKPIISKKENFSPQLDAVYIPTIGKRKHLKKIIKKVHLHTKHIYILLTDNSPEWLNKFSTEYNCTLYFQENYIILNKIKLKTKQNPSQNYLTDYDIPHKRNFAICHAKENKFNKIALIDDDIIFTSTDILQASRLLDKKFDIVGFHVTDFPDLSTIDHIQRNLTNNRTFLSIGGNFLFFRPLTTCGFFPEVYNEDWIFIFTNLDNKRRICSLGTVKQLKHKPWKNNIRIKQEQFGDILIIGLEERIMRKKKMLKGSTTFWTRIYKKYLRKLNFLLRKTDKSQWKTPLILAQETCKEFSPVDFQKFVYNLIDDIKTINV